MSDIISSTWTQLDEGNTSPVPDGLPAGTEPTKLYPFIRADRGATKREFVNSNPVYTSTGTATAYALMYDQAPLVAKGKSFAFWPHIANTGAATININNLGAVTILRPDGTPLLAGDMVTTSPAKIAFNGTQYVLANPQKLTGTNISGTIPDANLPSTLSAKTIDGNLTLQNGQILIKSAAPIVQLQETDNSDKNWFIVLDGGNLSIRENSTTNTRLLIENGTSPTSLKMDGQTVWTSGNDGIGSGLDADLLDGQQGAFYLDRANHTGTQPVSTITGLDSLLNTKLSLTGGNMSGNLVLSNGSNPTPITFNAANGSITAGGLVHIQSSGTNAAVLEMRAPANASAIIDFSPNGYGGDFVWRINAHPDTASFDIIHTGTHRFRLRNDGAIWNSYSGWLHDKFADRGAQIQHNSGVWEFGSIDPNYNDRTTDAPNPWVLVGLRGSRGTNVINMRAVWLRNN
ncbi:hypothetical protein [Rhizobium sp. P007]|uniref:hypothetical protein n=1 Tax=Rhizobium sp. P007 TaxID=285908 RepID=UPI0011571D5C|nr:hypothetical protein [Rhizobium sp. P007]CAD7041244.1 hypothetical protein RP007_00726 [Rhizobium sp. P007]